MPGHFGFDRPASTHITGRLESGLGMGICLEGRVFGAKAMEQSRSTPSNERLPIPMPRDIVNRRRRLEA